MNDFIISDSVPRILLIASGDWVPWNRIRGTESEGLAGVGE